MTCLAPLPACLALALSALALPSSAAAGPLSRWSEGRNYVGLILESAHIAPRTAAAEGLNNHTLGLTFGHRWPVGRRPGRELSLEGGVFYNSYRETGPLLIFGYSDRVADLGKAGALRLGAFTGFAYYRRPSGWLKAKYGIPNVDGMVPLVGLSAVWRMRRSELRLTAVPPGELTAILNLSWTVAF